MTQKPLSHRKAAGSFVTENSATRQKLQLSPRLNPYHVEQQRSPFTLYNNNHISKTNFIGDSIVVPEGPRAVAVSETGEKHSIIIDEDMIRMNNSTNPFATVQSTPSIPNRKEPSSVPNLPEQVAKEPPAQKEVEHVKSSKKSKCPRHLVAQRQRLIFTPRHIERLSAPLPAVKPQIYNAETQTDLPMAQSKSVQVTCMPTTEAIAAAYLQHMPSLATIQQLRDSKVASTLQRTERFSPFPSSSVVPPRLSSAPTTPLPIYTETESERDNDNLKKYSEFRSIASAITLITVVSWLISIYFDLAGIRDFFYGIFQALQNLFRIPQKPKTKVELLVQFLQDLLTT